MAEKYKGKKYNAYILTCSEREQTFTRHFDALSRHTTQHFMPSAKYVAIWRFSGAQLCAFGWVCACVLVRMTKPCTGQWQWQCVDVSMCGWCCVVSSFRFAGTYFKILCVFVDVSCIRIMFCIQLAPFVFRTPVAKRNH